MLNALMLSAAAAVDGGAPPFDLTAEVRALYDVVTCQAEAPDAGPVAEYCRRQVPRLKRFREHWGTNATAFFQSIEPSELPHELVYPFGGGDLMMALATFPKADVITTLSLELSGDPRRLAGLDAAKLKNSLDGIFECSGSTLTSNDSKSVNLSRIQQGDLPGQLSMHLIGLGLFDLVPVSARYFRIDDDGSLHYYTAGEVEALAREQAKNLKSNWKPPDFSIAFANVELAFVPRGDLGAKPRLFRHIGANLDDEHLPKGLLKHLESKGRVTAMTKAASYLLWRDAFSTIRGYLTGHAQFMISDSTGVLPHFWPKGCEVKTYGAFDQTFLGTYKPFQEELQKQYATQPHRALPMRFGYPDGSPEKKNHLFTVECRS